MSIRLMAEVWDMNLTGIQKLVLLKLADNADDDGRSVRPGIAYLVTKTSLSERAIRNALRELELLGLIEATGHARGGRGRKTEFQLHITRHEMPPLDPVKGAPAPVKGARGAEPSSMNHHEPSLRGMAKEPPSPIQNLVSFYVDECISHGYKPIGLWRTLMGKHIKALGNEKPEDIVRSAIRVLADERKVPSSLASVIADIESGRSDNGKHPR